jgi:nicotinate-nucleotide adenylyltransferase
LAVGNQSNLSPPVCRPSKIWLGGGFNPVHHGHLLLARAAAEALGIETVVLLPNNVAPLQKFHPETAAVEEASATDRLAMCRLAVAGVSGFEVDDREIRRPGPSYTIDTVRELAREGWPKVHWILGADQVLGLSKWYSHHDLIAETHFVVLRRPGYTLDWPKMPPELGQLKECVVDAPAIDISSTEIRRRVRQGLPIDFLTPPAVCRYIAERGLYRASRNPT